MAQLALSIHFALSICMDMKKGLKLEGEKIVNLNKQNRDRDVIVKKLWKQEVANRDGNSQYCLNVPIQVKLLDLCAQNLRFLFRLVNKKKTKQES